MVDTNDATTKFHWIAIDVARYWNAVIFERLRGLVIDSRWPIRPRTSTAWSNLSNRLEAVAALASSQPGTTIDRLLIGCCRQV